MKSQLIPKHQKPAQPLVLQSAGRTPATPEVDVSNYTSAPNRSSVMSGNEAGSEFVANATQQIHEQGAAAQAAAEREAKTAERARSLVAKKTQAPFKVNEDYENTVKMQQALYDTGFYGKTALNRAVDGIVGKGTRRALAAAEKLDIFQDGKLIKPTLKEKSTQISHKTAENPGFISDAFNFITRHHPGTTLFTERPFQGSEEEARKLGYKYYTSNGFTRYPVDYSVEGQETMTPQEIAQAQLDQYGITSEQTRDKSPFATFIYEYSPGYGYNVARLLENAIRGNKVRENGQRVIEKIETPIADKFTESLAQFADKIGLSNFAKDMQAQKGYQINESAQRSDLCNLFFGYPMQGKSVRISQRTETGKGNKPIQGYFYEFTNDNHIYDDAAYAKAQPGGRGVEASGENMGTWSASIDTSGNKAYYDLWDINPLTHIPGLESLPNMDFLGTGFELYGKQRNKK